MISTFINAWKVADLRKKMLFTALIVLIFRIGAAIPVPFTNISGDNGIIDPTGETFMNYLSMMTGEAFAYGTIFALSITPYINSSIIIQLLGVVIPALEKLSKEGEEGRKKIATITRYTTIALAALIGDQREDTDPDKIHQENVRSILNDEELYTIHKEVNIEEARKVLQGTNTEANFSENYIYAEAMIMAALYAREQYKGTGTPDYYCAPHSINVMLLARDLNGRRIYDSKADLAKALNVNEIYEIEQLEGRTRTNDKGETKKLLGLFVNLADYQFGSTKGGELTKFEDFDINFNTYQYLMETRLSGALTKPFSAIALEEPVKA